MRNSEVEEVMLMPVPYVLLSGATWRGWLELQVKVVHRPEVTGMQYTSAGST